jgi:hypothetical protein
MSYFDRRREKSYQGADIMNNLQELLFKSELKTDLLHLAANLLEETNFSKDDAAQRLLDLINKHEL